MAASSIVAKAMVVIVATKWEQGIIKEVVALDFVIVAAQGAWSD
jgi:hypothetical protein